MAKLSLPLQFIQNLRIVPQVLKLQVMRRREWMFWMPTQESRYFGTSPSRFRLAGSILGGGRDQAGCFVHRNLYIYRNADGVYTITYMVSNFLILGYYITSFSCAGFGTVSVLRYSSTWYILKHPSSIPHAVQRCCQFAFSYQRTKTKQESRIPKSLATAFVNRYQVWVDVEFGIYNRIRTGQVAPEVRLSPVFEFFVGQPHDLV